MGDPDQSIYQFRGADPEGLVRLVEVPGAEVIKLECNYRSDISICEAANKLIAHNKLRVDKKIVPVSQEKGAVEVARFEDTWIELGVMETTIRTRSPECSVAVLCRTNFEVNRCHNYLAAQHIQVRRQYQVQRPPDWQRALLLLSLAASPDNEILAERYLKLDNPTAIVDQWLLESRAGGQDFTERTKLSRPCHIFLVSWLRTEWDRLQSRRSINAQPCYRRTRACLTFSKTSILTRTSNARNRAKVFTLAHTIQLRAVSGTWSSCRRLRKELFRMVIRAT